MKPDNRKKREEQILKAAYSVLDSKGFAGLSMLAVAKAAKASNETLYRWYGDKQGLFLALVEANLEDAKQVLDKADQQGDVVATLRAFGPVLLKMLVGPRAVALNRAAAADPSGTLGAALAKGGREVVRPRIMALMAQAQEPETLAELYLTFLVGDLQIRRVTGALDPLSDTAVQERADAALEMFLMMTGWGGETQTPPITGKGQDTSPRKATRGHPFWLGWVRN